MDYFSIHSDSFDQCLYNLILILKRCIEANLVLTSKKIHFMFQQAILLGHVISTNKI